MASFKRAWGRRVVGVGAALSVVVAAVVGIDTDDVGVLLELLSPPGAGYDSTNIALSTSTGLPVTFARASTATCEDSNGSIRSLASGKPCVVDGASLRVRSAVTNPLLWSEEVNRATSWVAVGTAGPLVPAVLTNAATAPDLATTAESVAFAAVASGGNASAMSQDFTGTAAAYSGGIWLRAASGTPTVYLWFATGGTTFSGTATACVLSSTAWTRCKHENKTLTAATWALRFGVDTRDASQSAQSAATVYAWGAQTNIGATLGDYCPTGASSATCAAETATVATPASLSVTEGCVCLNITPSWSGGPEAYRYYLRAGATTRLLAYSVAGQDLYRASDGTNTTSVIAGYAAGVRKRYCTRWSASQAKLRVENATSGAANETAFAGFAAFAAAVDVGHNGGVEQANANLDSIVFGSSFGACR